MIKALLFDFGGTLDTGGVHWYQMFRDSYMGLAARLREEQVTLLSWSGMHNVRLEQLLREAYIKTEQALGREVIIEPDFDFYKTIAAKVRLQACHLRGAGLELDSKAEKWLVDRLHAFVKRYVESVSKPLLEELSKSFTLALVTNFYGNMESVLREFALDGLFSCVVESATVGVRKPDPAIFAKAVAACGVEPFECLVTGDSFENDIKPALQAGCHTVWLDVRGFASGSQEDYQGIRIKKLEELPYLI